MPVLDTPSEDRLKALQPEASIRKLRPKSSLASPRVARLFEFGDAHGWELGKFRKYYGSGRKRGQYEIKFDDGDRRDLELEIEAYGIEGNWILYAK